MYIEEVFTEILKCDNFYEKSVLSHLYMKCIKETDYRSDDIATKRLNPLIVS